jgi:hypothetical protein
MNRSNKPPGGCACNPDPFADLPPELRPRRQPKKSDLREVTCPGCELHYWTNRPTDVCMECEKKGVKDPNLASKSGD